jgi:hypothetical protein
MPNVRRLKKDIDCLVFEVISDCFSFGKLHPEEKLEEVTEIISDAVSLRNDLFSRVNNPVKGDNPAVIRTHFRNVKKDLYVGVDNLFTRLSHLTSDR